MISRCITPSHEYAHRGCAPAAALCEPQPTTPAKQLIRELGNKRDAAAATAPRLTADQASPKQDADQAIPRQSPSPGQDRISRSTMYSVPTCLRIRCDAGAAGPVARRPVPHGPTPLRRAVHPQVPVAGLGQRRGAITGSPPDDDPARSPVVALLALERVRPVRQPPADSTHQLEHACETVSQAGASPLAQFTANQATLTLFGTALFRWMVNDPDDPVTSITPCT